jgi:hypothetical protein
MSSGEELSSQVRKPKKNMKNPLTNPNIIKAQIKERSFKMYRITITTPGKYNNISLGARYCFTKKDARKLAKLFFEGGANMTVEKFIHITGTVFCWSDSEVEDNIFPEDYWEE